MTSLTLSRLHFPVTTLGPGRRIGVWFQGCAIRCAGCISPDTWDPNMGKTTLGDVIASIAPWVPHADGLTISGGEPFEQPDALAEFLEAWRALSDADVLVFTGFEFTAVERWLRTHPGLVDAVVAGPFRLDEPQTVALRGSDNQTLHLLTLKGEQHFAGYERPAEAGDRRLDLMLDEDGGAWFAGIPGRGDFDRLRRVLREGGHRMAMTERGVRP